VHQRKSITHGSSVHDLLACDWTIAAVGQRGGHDGGRVNVGLDGTELKVEIHGFFQDCALRKTSERYQRVNSVKTMLSADIMINIFLF